MTTKRKLSGISPGCKSKPGLRSQKCVDGLWRVFTHTGRIVAEFATEQEAEQYLRWRIEKAKAKEIPVIKQSCWKTQIRKIDMPEE